jgi:hypothetical protein
VERRKSPGGAVVQANGVKAIRCSSGESHSLNHLQFYLPKYNSLKRNYHWYLLGGLPEKLTLIKAASRINYLPHILL